MTTTPALMMTMTMTIPRTHLFAVLAASKSMTTNQTRRFWLTSQPGCSLRRAPVPRALSSSSSSSSSSSGGQSMNVTEIKVSNDQYLDLLRHHHDKQPSSMMPRHNDEARRLFSSSTKTMSTASTTSTTTTTTTIDRSNPDCNIPPHIADKVLSSGLKLYQISPHPLYIIKKRIEDYFHNLEEFEIVDDRSPIVPTTSNFDSLLIPKDHVSRSKSDTYYLSNDVCLRTHTSAHQVELLREGHTRFLCTGDVYRRDDIDSSHYPIFHQMEGVKVFSTGTNGEPITHEEVLDDLKRTLEGLAVHLFGPNTKCRWVDEYFPFTHPSLELEVLYKRENDISTRNSNSNSDDGDDDYDEEDWLEVLGCGVMRPEILQNGIAESTSGESSSSSSSSSSKAWAFGLGLERLAMILFEIPDIRLFWTSDERFWKQFSEDTITKFQPYSKYPPCFKDISFWLNNDDCDGGQQLQQQQQQQQTRPFHVNEFLDILRGVAGDLVENVQLVDQFVHPKTQRESHCYRITYRSMDRSLTNEEIDELQEEFRQKVETDLPSVELR